MSNEHDHSHDHGPSHSHDHGHDHGHSHDGGDPFHPKLGAPIDTSEMDPANRSLAEALRLSFAILSVIMVALVILYVLSGIYKVNENEVAVVLQFGRLKPGVVKPGGPYWHWPKPIEQVVRIPTSLRPVDIDEAFWFEVKPEERSKPLDQFSPKTQLQPGTDGSLVTGDRNIVHGRWSISYQVAADQADKFVRNVSAAGEPRDMTAAAEVRVRHAAERAIVHVVASVDAEAFIRGQDLSAEIKRRTQEKLDELQSGITIMAVATSQAIPPLSVRNEFDAVTKAFSEQATKQEDARKEAEKTLSDAAGPAHKALALAIDYYETARRDGDQAAADKGLGVINALLEGEPAGKVMGALADDKRTDAEALRGIVPDATLGGEASKMLSEAQSFRRTAQTEARAEANRFNALLTDYRDPDARRTYMARRWYEVYGGILAGKVQVRISPPGSHEVLEVNPDPRWQRIEEEAKFRAEQEADKKKRDISNIR